MGPFWIIFWIGVSSHLQINVSKTKEMTIEFYNSVEIPSKVVIAGKEVEKVSSYKYLGTLIDDKLRWVENTNLIISKAQKRLYLLRKLKSFEVDKSILIMFYRSLLKLFWPLLWSVGFMD